MQYDPIKRTLGNIFNRSPWLRVLFYKLIDLLLLRSWHVRRELKKWYKSQNGRAIHLFDAGFGFGQYSYFASKLGNGITVTGIDLKDEQVADCNDFFGKIGRKNVRFITGDLTQYHDDQAFDFILSVDVMEHILEDVDVFKNFHRSLKDGGMVLISTPSDQGGSDVHDHEESSFIEEHVRDGYSFKDIEDKLKSAGFSRVECRYSYGTYGKISWRLSMKYPLLLVNKSKAFLVILPFYYLLAYPIAWVCNCLDVRVHNASGTGLIVKAYK
jgi:SAM-dependent methyltransferase